MSLLPITAQLRLFMLVVLLLSYNTRPSAGFPTLDDPEQLRVALQAIHNEDGLTILPGMPVDRIFNCITMTTSEICGNDRLITKNEVRLRNGYKTRDEPCSSDPELGELVLKPPKPFPSDPYLIWQNRILNSSQSFCNPFKHLRCSTTSRKCVCRKGLDWQEERFEILHHNSPLRIREKICVIPLEQPCNDNSQPLYFNIFIHNIALPNDPPHCGLGECSNSSYQRHQVCVPRGWNNDTFHLDNYFEKLANLGRGEKCNVEENNRLNAFSKEEQSPGFLAKRRKNLEELKSSGANRFCNLDYFLTCHNGGTCQCLYPTVTAKPPDAATEYCAVLKDHKYNQCEMSPELNTILENKTLTTRAKNLLMNALSHILKTCPPNFQCTFEGNEDMPMELFCTCPVNKAGMDCRDNLTNFLLYVRVPSFPKDVTDILEKRQIFNELNKKAIEFETVFRIPEFSACNSTAESIAKLTIDRLELLDKIGTVMTKADFVRLSDSIVKLTKDLKTEGLCQRFVPHPLECNGTSGSCVIMDLDTHLENCRKAYPFICNGNRFTITRGGCACTASGRVQLGVNTINESPSIKIQPYIVVVVVIIVHSFVFLI